MPAPAVAAQDKKRCTTGFWIESRHPTILPPCDRPGVLEKFSSATEKAHHLAFHGSCTLFINIE